MWGKYFYYGQESDLSKAFKKQELKLLVEENFIPDDVLEAFYMDSGVQMIVETYSSNEELFNLLQNNSYDIVSFKLGNLKELLNQKLLDKLNTNSIKNKENIAADFLSSPVDKESQFSLPIYWGVTGLLVNKSKIKENISSIRELASHEYKLWTENIAIPKNSNSKKTAHYFVDFLLQKETAMELVKFRNQSMTNKLLEDNEAVSSEYKPSYLRKISISKIKYTL